MENLNSFRTPSGDVLNFLSSYKNKFGIEDHINFVSLSFDDSVLLAENSIKFLLVFLYRSDKKTDYWFRFTLNSPKVVSFLDKNADQFLIWGCDISSGEGEIAARSMGCYSIDDLKTCPYFGVMVWKDNKMSYVHQITEPKSASDFIEQLQKTIDKNKIYLDDCNRERCNDVIKFVDDYEREFGEHPAFLRCSYKDALAKAKSENKFLLVFLQQKGEKADEWCRHTLNNPDVLYVLKEFLMWGCDISLVEGRSTASILKPVNYPSLTILMFQNNLIKVIYKTGIIIQSASVLTIELENIIEIYRIYLEDVPNNESKKQKLSSDIRHTKLRRKQQRTHIPSIPELRSENLLSPILPIFSVCTPDTSAQSRNQNYPTSSSDSRITNEKNNFSVNRKISTELNQSTSTQLIDFIVNSETFIKSNCHFTSFDLSQSQIRHQVKFNFIIEPAEKCKDNNSDYDDVKQTWNYKNSSISTVKSEEELEKFIRIPVHNFCSEIENLAKNNTPTVYNIKTEFSIIF